MKHLYNKSSKTIVSCEVIKNVFNGIFVCAFFIITDFLLFYKIQKLCSKKKFLVLYMIEGGNKFSGTKAPSLCDDQSHVTFWYFFLSIFIPSHRVKKYYYEKLINSETYITIMCTLQFRNQERLFLTLDCI